MLRIDGDRAAPAGDSFGVPPGYTLINPPLQLPHVVTVKAGPPPLPTLPADSARNDDGEDLGTLFAFDDDQLGPLSFDGY